MIINYEHSDRYSYTADIHTKFPNTLLTNFLPAGCNCVIIYINTEFINHQIVLRKLR